MNTGVIYARFSSHGQNEQSIEAQVRICKECAEKNNIKIVNVYSDKARTGTNDARPAFQRMIADAKSGAFQYIVVYMFDRFARNRRDSILYKEMLKENGIKVISALEPIAEDEGGEFYEMFLEWNAEKYSKRLSKRVRDGIDTSIANGHFCGGTVIFGYKLVNEPIPGKPNKFIKKVVIDEEEAKIIRLVFDYYKNGYTKKEIARILNEQGYRVHGKKITGKTFDKYIVNPKYTGEFTFGGRECKNMYPQIIDKETFNAVQEKLAKNRYTLGGRETARIPYLLTGKVFCGHCGTGMVADSGKDRHGNMHYYYTCKKRRKHECNKSREHKDNLELYVTTCVRDFLSNRENAETAVNDVLSYYDKRTDEQNIKSIAAKISSIKKEVSKLTDAYVNAKSELLRNSIEEKMTEYEVLIVTLETQKAQLEIERGYKITKQDLLPFIEEILKGDVNDKDYQKQIIDHLVSQVFVSDDNTVIYFNLRGGKDIETLTVDDTKAAVNKAKMVRTQLPFVRQVKPKSNTKVFGLGFSFAKIRVLSAFFTCRCAVVLYLSGFVWLKFVSLYQ